MSLLIDSLKSVDWRSSVDAFSDDETVAKKIEEGCHLVSVWTHELSFQYFDNPALPFLQEMKASLFYVPACFALGLYKPAASSMRASVENALYFSYFCEHPAELKTLVRDEAYYISKSRIIEYHQTHTPSFKLKQTALGFIGELESWYSEISAIVHGQIPGVWTSASLAGTYHDPAILDLGLTEFNRAVSLINVLFLITVDEDIWNGFSSPARRLFLKGMSGSKKSSLDRSIV
jgi:hypothetical protein